MDPEDDKNQIENDENQEDQTMNDKDRNEEFMK